MKHAWQFFKKLNIACWHTACGTARNTIHAQQDFHSWQVSWYLHTGLPIFKRIQTSLTMCVMYFLESFSPYNHKKKHFKIQQSSNLENTGWDVCVLLIATLFLSVPLKITATTSQHVWLIYWWDTATKWKRSYGITFSTKTGVEIDFKSIDSFKTIITHLGMPLVRMIDRWASWNLNTARLLKIEVTEDAQILKMLCMCIRIPLLYKYGRETTIQNR